MRQSLCTITSNVGIMPGVNLMWIEAPDMAATAQPGQFVTVRCGDSILRRPFSIHQVVIASQAKQSRLALLFKVLGKGTLWLSQRHEGDKVDLLGPLGRGFSIPSVIARREVPRQSRNLLLVSGGIGIAPLIFLLQRTMPQHRVRLICGASTGKELYAFPPLPNGVQFIPVTEDGSVGRKGLASDVLPDFLDWADQIYACGPVGMYEAMSKYLHPLSSLRAKALSVAKGQRSNLKCQVSLELRMGCGIGACYGCSINTKKGLKKVCCDGPVFELDDILWKEVRI